jgi:hypothetical protein
MALHFCATGSVRPQDRPEGFPVRRVLHNVVATAIIAVTLQSPLAEPFGGDGHLPMDGGGRQVAHATAVSLGSMATISSDTTVDQTVGTASLDGYALMAGVGATRLGRVVRMDPTVPSGVRQIVQNTVNQINDASGAGLVIGPDTSALPTADEIVVRVPNVTVCGALAAGCSSNSIGTTKGIGVVTNALVEIKRDLLGSGYETPILMHEMGHAMGLSHYEVPYRNLMQMMWHSVSPDMTAYRAGDRNGLAALTAPFANRNVIGNLDEVRQTPQGIRVIGWTLDLDAPALALGVRATIDSVTAASGTANLSRPDVGAAFAGAGNLHGFDLLVPTPAREGVFSICVDAVGHRGQQVRVACRNLAVTHQPIGHLDGAAQSGPGRVRVGGWSLDPDTASPIAVHLYVNGQIAQGVMADRPRVDVGSAYPGYGPNHGFDTELGGLPGGSHRVCAYGIDSQGGTNPLLGCRVVTVASGNPIGNLEGPLPSWLFPTVMTGWALDPDTAAPIAVHLYVNGRIVAGATANGARPDVGSAYPGYGSNHGFSVALPELRPGTHQGCIYAINEGPGSGNPLIGCRSFTTPGGVPFGHLDSVRITAGGVAAAGWTIDPDTTAPISVHVYVDGQLVAAANADRVRPDVGSAYPGYGDSHGFVVDLAKLDRGLRTVCVFAINVATGTYNPGLGCQQVSIS